MNYDISRQAETTLEEITSQRAKKKKFIWTLEIAIENV